MLTGTPTAAGVFTVTLLANNTAGAPATLDMTVAVEDEPAPTTGSLGSLSQLFGQLIPLPVTH